MQPGMSMTARCRKESTMSRRSAVLILVGASVLATACGNGGRMAAAHTAATRSPVGNACDRKLLTARDAATVIADPITGSEPIPGAPGSCKFTTGSYSSVMVSLRPGGMASLAVWKSGRMPVSGTPLAGVGDEAVWVNELTEVVSEQNDLLCDIQVSGLAAVLDHQPAAARQKAIGALCNKIFAAVR
jgi:hypothetical protein